MKHGRLEKLDGDIVRAQNNSGNLLLDLQNSGYERHRIRCYNSSIEFVGITSIDAKSYFREWHEFVGDWRPNGWLGNVTFEHGSACFETTTYGPGDAWTIEYRLACSDVRWNRKIDRITTVKSALRQMPDWVWIGVLLPLLWPVCDLANRLLH